MIYLHQSTPLTAGTMPMNCHFMANRPIDDEECFGFTTSEVRKTEDELQAMLDTDQDHIEKIKQVPADFNPTLLQELLLASNTN